MILKYNVAFASHALILANTKLNKIFKCICDGHKNRLPSTEMSTIWFFFFFSQEKKKYWSTTCHCNELWRSNIFRAWHYSIEAKKKIITIKTWNQFRYECLKAFCRSNQTIIFVYSLQSTTRLQYVFHFVCVLRFSWWFSEPNQMCR